MAGALVLFFVLFHDALCSFNYDLLDDFDYTVPAFNDQLYYLNPTSQGPQEVLFNVNDNNRYPSPSIDDIDALERLIYALTKFEPENNGHQTSPVLKPTQDLIPSLLLPITLPSVYVPSYERFPYKSTYLSSPLTTALPPRTASIGVPISSSNYYLTSPSIFPLSSIPKLTSSETHITSKDVVPSLTNLVPSFLNVESKLPSSSEAYFSLPSLLMPNLYGAEDVSFSGSVPASGSFRVSAKFSPDGNVNNCDPTNSARSNLLHTASVCPSADNFNNHEPITCPVNNSPIIPENIYRQSLLHPLNLNKAINVDSVYKSETMNMHHINQPVITTENIINRRPYTVISDNNFSRKEPICSSIVPITEDLISRGHNIDSSAINNDIITDYVPFSGTVQAKGKFTVAAHF